MRLRLLALFVLLALVVVACGGVAEETTTTHSETTTTEAVIDAPEAVLLSYSLEAGQTWEYEVGLDQHLDVSASGDASFLGDEEFPGEASLNLVGTTTFSYSVADGPEEGTYEVTIIGDFSDLEVTGTLDGEPIDATDLPEFAEMAPVDVTVVVDEQGNIIVDDEVFGDVLGGGLDGLGGLGDMTAPGMDPGRFVGPPFADREVTIGDSWSETIETPMFPGDEPIITQIDSEVTGTDTLDGVEVFLIDTTSTTSMIEFDLAQFLVGFFQAFTPEDATAGEQAEIDAIVEDLEFLFVIDETVSNMSTWFDTDAGITRKALFDSSTDLTIDLNLPDDDSGDMVALGVEMSITQAITYRLVGSPEA